MSIRLLIACLIGFGLITLLWIFGIWFSKPNPQLFPKDVYISNITDNSASVSWVSADPSKSKVLISDNGFFLPVPLPGKSYKDIKENQAKDNQFRVHYVNITDLEPKKNYWAAIYSGWNKVKVVKFKTTPKMVTLKKPKLIQGEILAPDGQTRLKGVNVYYQATFGASESAVLSTISNDSGVWQIDIGNLLTRDLKRFFQISDGIKQSVLFEAGSLGSFQLESRKANLPVWPTAILTEKK